MSASSTIVQFDHFIPVSTSHLIEALSQAGIEPDEMQVIHKLKQILSFQFYQKLVTLKQLYQPFNPDRELLIGDSADSKPQPCIDAIKEVLSAANYNELDQQQIEYALQKTSPYVNSWPSCSGPPNGQSCDSATGSSGSGCRSSGETGVGLCSWSSRILSFAGTEQASDSTGGGNLEEAVAPK